MDRPRIAILGAGISGLAAAHFAVRHATRPEVTLFESSDRVGGLLKTEQVDDFLIESTADSFLVNQQLPWAGRLAEEVGFEQLVPPENENRRALILKEGTAYPVPEGFYLMAATSFPGIWKSPVLSWPAKLRLRMESWIPAGNSGDDISLADFA
ncbi:MAG: FAD-dependent oxidoreductase, partial [Planctomycetota bacterium]